MAKQFDTDKIFTYHPPFGTQQERYEQIREQAKWFAELILRTTPPSREQAVALTNLQQSVMWANAAIAINEMVPAVATEPQPNQAPALEAMNVGQGQ